MILPEISVVGMMKNYLKYRAEIRQNLQLLNIKGIRKHVVELTKVKKVFFTDYCIQKKGKAYG